MDIKIFIGSLKRDKARGKLAPHQIILLTALYRLYYKNKTSTFNIDELIIEFNEIWENNKLKFHSINNNIGMPLKVFEKKGYLHLKHKNIENRIEDYRNTTNLKESIEGVKTDNVLIQLFKTDDCSERYILSNI